MKTSNCFSHFAILALALAILSLASWSAQAAGDAAPIAPMSALNKNYQIPEATLRQMLGAPRAQAEPVIDYQSVMPPVYDTKGTDADSVSASMGYYYQTFQQYMNHRDVWTTTGQTNQVDPADLYRMSGGLNFYFAGEALTRVGGESPSLPGRYRALGYGAFFSHKVIFDKHGHIAAPYKNNIETLKTWLAGTATKAGDCLCIGIPVGAAWDLCTTTTGVYPDEVKDPANPAQNLLAGPDEETFKSYRALCIVGYSDAMRAFKAVNCQGAGWGNNGYIWLNYDFVTKYAIEAWFLADNAGFLATDPNPDGHWKPSGSAAKIWDNDEYVITYRGRGQILVTTAGVTITDSGLGDTLSIRRAAKAPQFLNNIPRIEIQTTQEFKKIETIGVVVNSVRVTTAGLTFVSCINSWIGAVDALTLKDVRMSAGVNSTWSKLNPDDKNISTKTVMDLAMAGTSLYATTDTKTLAVNLVGVGLRGVYLDAPKAEVTINIASKLGLRRALIPAFGSYGKLTGEVRVGAIKKINVAGGRINNAVIAAKEKGIVSIQTHMLTFASAVVFPQGWSSANVDLDGDIEATIISNDRIGLIQAISGDINIGVAAAGRIDKVWSEHRDGQGGVLSGMLVSGLGTGGTLAAVPMASAILSTIDIGLLYGEESVDVTLAAGAYVYQSANEIYIKPNCLGAIGKIGAKNPYTGDPSNYGNTATPSIKGKAWCKQKPNLAWWQADFDTYTDNAANTIFDIYNQARLTPPANDSFAGALTFILGGKQPVSGSTHLASSEAGEPLVNGAPAATVWYKFTAVSSGTASLSLNGGGGQAGLNVYTGPSVNALTEVAAGSLATFSMNSGVTYYVRVYAIVSPGSFLIYTYSL
ncbi:MAG: hypothetical protein NTX50_14765 [Candidatus Sumerlaeota bacterium]|nr:hypothetical protein [Candidatus Sumerlaeota bacterium]